MDIGNYKIGSDYKLDEEAIYAAARQSATITREAWEAYAPCCMVEGCENLGRNTDFVGTTLLLCGEHSLVVNLLRPIFTRFEAGIQELYVKLEMLLIQHRSLADDVRTIEYTVYEEVEEAA